jgi:metallo-beta-lactamase family protein
MSAVRLDILGAAGTVTGSKFLVSTDDSAVLVDCGLFQGERELRRRNWEPFPVDVHTIDVVALSHAHLDHSGYLPALVALGYSGPICATDGTAELAAIVLRDSARLLGEDADFARKHGFSKHAIPKPLYTEEDAERAIAQLRAVPFDERVELTEQFSAQFRRAGHILGSSSVLLEAEGRRIVFSGDLGRRTHPLLSPPEPVPSADVVVVESTYGDRQHPDPTDAELGEVITRTIARGGSVVIPAFAVDRTEVILMALAALQRTGAVPDVPIYVDSPMALAALEVYRRALREGDPELRKDVVGDDAALRPFGLREARTVEESKRLNAPEWPCVIVSASGMATGGRVLHHLAELLPDPRNAVVLVGYQAVGTRGRLLAEGARTLKIHGRYVPVRADVATVQGYSVHADADDLVEWLAGAATPPHVVYVVHGEPAASEALAARVTADLGWPAVVPRMGERLIVE